MNASTFHQSDEAVTVTCLSSGYWHLRGIGLCNWAQPRRWPSPEADLEAAFFEESGEPFRRAVRAENERLLRERRET